MSKGYRALFFRHSPCYGRITYRVKTAIPLFPVFSIILFLCVLGKRGFSSVWRWVPPARPDLAQKCLRACIPSGSGLILTEAGQPAETAREEGLPCAARSAARPPCSATKWPINRMYIAGRTPKKIKPNLHAMTLQTPSGSKRLTVCTRCMRTLRKHGQA